MITQLQLINIIIIILKTIKIFKKYYQLIAVTWQHMFSMAIMITVWSRLVFNISNIDKDINKELPEDDLIEDRNMLQCFRKCFK